MDHVEKKIEFTRTGILLGLLFPIVAVLVDLLRGHLRLTVENVWILYAHDPLRWGILAAPLILGLAFHFISRRAQHREDQFKLDENRNRRELNKLESAIADLAAGKFTHDRLEFQNARLGALLVSLQDQLQHQKEEEEKSTWIGEGHARFGELFRETQDLTALADLVLKNLVHYCQCNQGSVFILHDSEQPDAPLELASSYAYERKKFFTKTIQPGEGVVGQCLLEKETIVLYEVPQNFVKITSGLGEANPNFILVVPIKSNNLMEGVLEIAGFKKLMPYQIAFIEKVCEGFASVIRVIKANQKTRTLLNETQTQTELLRAQEEEMRQNMEELHATQEAMERKSHETEDVSNKLKAVFDSAVDAIVTISERGVIETVNTAGLDMFGFTREELVGQNISLLMPEPHHSNHHQYLQTYLKTGQAKIIGRTRMAKARKKDGASFPVDLAVNEAAVGGHKIFTGIIRDISDRVALEMERTRHEEELRDNMVALRAAQDQLTAQLAETKQMRYLSETRETVLGLTTILSETDLAGKITYVNEKFCEVAKYQSSELIGQPHNIVRHPDMPKALFKLLWEVIKQGNVFRGIVKNRAKDGSAYWVDATIVPIKDESGRVTKYVGARYHITDEQQALKLYNAQADHFNWPRL